jgi:4-amino-4-deoxy-L-arabinose transferase-like glycosyltransferase
MKLSIKYSPTIMFVLLLSVAASLAIYYSTKWGPWAFSDSTEYIVAARNFIAGRGLGFYAPSGTFERLSLHPPLYPLVLSTLGYLGFDLIQAARLLNIVLFGGMIFLVGMFSYCFFNSAWLAIVLSVCFLTIPNLIDIFSGAMSESLFFFTATLGICMLTAYIKNRKRYLLILASISISLAFLSRYPGIALVVAGIFILSVFNQIPWKQRIRDIIEFCLISITPTAFWILWIYSRTQTFSSRKFHFTTSIWSDSIDLRKRLLEIFWSWLPFQGYIPPYSYNLSRNIFIILLSFLVLSFGYIFYRKIKYRAIITQSNHLLTFILLWIIFIVSYIILISYSFLFTTPQPDIIPRTLLPVQFGLAFILFALILLLINEFHLPSWVGWIPTSLALIIILPNAQTSWNIINQYHQYGAGFTSKNWHNSLTLQKIFDLQPNIPIITNQTAAVLLLADRAAYDFCTLPCNQSGILRYGDDPSDQVQQIFRANGAALVFFYPYCGAQSQPWYKNTFAQMKSITQNLTQYFSSCDGVIYFYPSK